MTTIDGVSGLNLTEHLQEARFETASGLTLVADLGGPQAGPTNLQSQLCLQLLCLAQLA